MGAPDDIEVDAEIVALTPELRERLRRPVADGERPVIVSGEQSRMTQPLAQALADAGGAWVIRTRDDGCYDAATGARLDEPRDALEPTTSAPHPVFVRGTLVSRIHLVATVVTSHPASAPVRPGGVLEAASEILSGAAPTAWGTTEPLVAGWDRETLTERSLSAGGLWAVSTAAEHPLIGTLAVRRTPGGLEQITRVRADVAGPGDARAESMGRVALDLLARAGGIGMPVLGAAYAAVGAADLTIRSTATLRPEPLALLVGPPGIDVLGVEPASWAAEAGGSVVGSAPAPSVLMPLGTARGGGRQRLTDVLAALDPARVAALAALAPGVIPRDD